MTTFALALLACAAAAPLAPHVVWAAKEPPIKLKDPGPCPDKRPEFTVIVFDVSTSVIESGGADPHRRAFAEARDLAQLLAEHPCSGEDAMAFISFADRPELTGVAPVADPAAVAAASRPPSALVGGGTDVPAALDKASSIAASRPDARVNVVVLSDMQVDNPAEVSHALGRFTPDQVHLVGLGHHVDRFDPSFSTVVELGSADRGEIARSLRDAIASSRAQSSPQPSGAGG